MPSASAPPNPVWGHELLKKSHLIFIGYRNMYTGQQERFSYRFCGNVRFEKSGPPLPLPTSSGSQRPLPSDRPGVQGPQPLAGSSGPATGNDRRSRLSFCVRGHPHLLESCSGFDLDPPGRGEQGPLDPCPGLWGRDLVTVSILRLLLLRESKLTMVPLFWGVAKYAEDSWLMRSPSFRSLLVLSS